MHDAVPSCFRGGEAEATPPASTQAGPRVTTSVYETKLGVAALTWYRTAFGLSLHVDLLLPSPASPSCSSASSVSSTAASLDWKNDAIRFRLRPWLFWKRRGTKRFYVKGEQHQERRHQTVVDFAWDLARARFPPGGGPEPAARFFVAVAVDGEMLLVVGDMEAEAYKKTPAVKHSIPAQPSKKGCSLYSATLISRREHAVLPSSGRCYTTRASLGGKEREISINLGREEGERDAKLSVVLDGGRVLLVKRLRWKFRGNEEVEVDGGARVQVSWDVHRWLFGRGLHPLPPASAAAASLSEPGHAVLLLRFNRDDPEEDGVEEVEASAGKHRRGGSSSSGSTIARGGSGGEGLNGVGSPFSGDAVGFSRRSGMRRSLLKTRSSSSSSSSAASESGSSVMEWASAEDVELSDTFSLMVNLWKS